MGKGCCGIGHRHTADDPTGEVAILLLNNPEIFDTPYPTATGAEVTMQAGAALPILDTTGAAAGIYDADRWTSQTSLAWFRVQLPAGAGAESGWMPAATAANIAAPMGDVSRREGIFTGRRLTSDRI